MLYPLFLSSLDERRFRHALDEDEIRENGEGDASEDSHGVSNKAFDGRGNYTLGIREQLIFPEIDYDKVNRVRGLDVVIVTTAKTDEEARELLTEFGMPFAK